MTPQGAMVVRRVIDSEWGGSHIEPPIKQTWTRLKKLRWKAGVETVDTGTSHVFQVARKSRVIPQGYVLYRDGHAVDSGCYSYMWAVLDSLEKRGLA